MRVLWIGTKPPWPAIDGGRLAAALTLESLAMAGAEILVLAPDVEPRLPAPPGIELRTVPGGPANWWWAAARGLLTGRSSTLDRHRVAALERAVEWEIERCEPSVVHVEQLQALAQAAPALRRGLPVVLRAQNVESDLWRGASELARGWRAGWLAREARMLARAEGEAVRRVSTTVALTARDAERLAALAGGRARVQSLAVPFPAELPAGPEVEGTPAVVLLGSGGWLPNQAGAEWFVSRVWPRVVASLPGARLHVFGEVPVARSRTIEVHPAPADSALAFPRGAILAVPLHVASGVRMKILEAWARGVAVVATSAAAAGLEARSGRELLVADEPEAFAAAIVELGDVPERSNRLVQAGRALLAERHDPAQIARGLVEIYRRSSPRAISDRDG